MRSVVVVLPAAPCATIPRFRVRSRGTDRSSEEYLATRGAMTAWWFGPSPPAKPMNWLLPAVVRESLVGVCHLVDVLALLDRVAAVLRGIDDLVRETVHHRLLVALAGVLDEPAHAE